MLQTKLVVKTLVMLGWTGADFFLPEGIVMGVITLGETPQPLFTRMATNCPQQRWTALQLPTASLSVQSTYWSSQWSILCTLLVQYMCIVQ